MTGGSAAPLSTATLLSTLEIGLGPSAARPPRRGAGRPIPNTISGGGGPSGGQRVGLRLVESSTTGPQRLPLPCRFPPVVRAGRPPRKRNSPKECRRRACPCKSSTGLEEYPPRARFLRLRRSIGRPPPGSPEDYLMPLDSSVRHQAERGPRAAAIYPGPAAAAAMPVQGAREIGCV